MSAPEKNKHCPICGEATSFGVHTLCRRRVREEEEARCLARYDEAIAMLRKGRSLDGWTFADEVKVDEFLSQEPGE